MPTVPPSFLTRNVQKHADDIIHAVEVRAVVDEIICDLEAWEAENERRTLSREVARQGAIISVLESKVEFKGKCHEAHVVHMSPAQT